LPLVAATWALAAALGASETLALGLRVEARGITGRAAGSSLVEPVPWQVEPTLDLTGLLAPQLSYSVRLAPRLLLLSGPDGGRTPDSAAGFYAGSGSLAWRADDRTTLSVDGAGSRGTLAMSALTQLSASAAGPGGAPPPGGTGLDPGAGLRTGEYASTALHAALEWRATQPLTLRGGLGWSTAGGLDEASRLLFPSTGILAAEGRAELALSRLDRLALQAGYVRTTLAVQGTAGIADALARWSRRLAPTTDAALAAGLAVTVEDQFAPATGTTASRLTPRAEASITEQLPASGTGLGYGANLGYAPYVDRFAGVILQRLTAGANLEWQLDPGHRLTWAISGATAVSAGSARQGVAATELTGWYRQRALELGLSLGGGYQEAQGTTSEVWQWSAAVITRWHQGPARE
jgi:hypothetical protein